VSPPVILHPHTPDHIAAAEALATQRITSFLFETSTPTFVTLEGCDTDVAISARRDAAAARIASFDKVFDRRHTEDCKDKSKK